MTRLMIYASSILIFCFTLMISVNAQDQNSDAQQKAWMEYMTPGWAHKMMAKSVGEWKSTTTFWMDPSAPPQTMEGSAKFEMLMGGRYLQSTHSGIMMGMPFEGMSLVGYDNDKKEFTSVWIDNLGTGTSISTGKYDKETNSITYFGTVYDPMQGKDVKIREIVKFIDKDHQKIEMFNDVNGNEVKSMEITLVREM